jgi:hypothetical protein
MPSMSLNPSNKLFLLLAGAVVAFPQEVPARVEIAASRNWVISGRTLSLDARALGEFGESLSAPFQWSSSNPAIAAVSTEGVVFGLLPGMSIIEASASGVTGLFRIYVHPARIELQPLRLELEIGAQSRLTARAFDADGAVISGPSFLYTSTLPGVVSVDAAGQLRAVAAGAATITAVLDIPEPAIGYATQTRVTVVPRPAFRAERLGSTSFTWPSTSLKTIYGISAAAGRLAFTAALSNGGLGVFVYENSSLRKLFATGDTFSQDRVVRGMQGVSINSNGDIAAVVHYSRSPSELLLIPAGKTVSDANIIPEPRGQGCCYCCLEISSRALGDNGDMVFGLWNGSADELFFRSASGRTEMLPTSNLPGLGRGQWMRGRASIAGPGQAVFQAGAPNATGLYHWDGRNINRLLVTGDTVFGQRMNWVDTPLPAAPGDFVTRMGSLQNNYLARFASGAWQKILEGGQQIGGFQMGGFQTLYDAAGPAVLFQADTDRGSGLFRLDGTSLQRIVDFSAPPAGRFQWVSQALLLPGGATLVQGPHSGAYGRVSSLGASESVLFSTGTPLNFPSPVSIDWTQIGGPDGDAVLAITPANAVIRLDRTAPGLLISPGDSLPGGSFIDWLSWPAFNSSGGFTVQAGTSQGQQVRLYSQGNFRVLAGAGSPLRTPSGEEFRLFHGAGALNNRNQAVLFAQSGSFAELFLISDTAPQVRSIIRQFAPAPGGGTIDGIRQSAVDDSGRVLFLASLSGGAEAIFLWENGQARRLLSIGDSLPDGARVSQIYGLKASSSRFFFEVNIPNSFNRLMETDGSQVRQALAVGDRTSFGEIITGFHYGGRFSIGPAGEIAYLAHLSGGFSALLVRDRNGRDQIAARINERLSNGLWVEDVFSSVWTSAQRLFIGASALGSTGRQDLFLATPQ